MVIRGGFSKGNKPQDQLSDSEADQRYRSAADDRDADEEDACRDAGNGDNESKKVGGDEAKNRIRNQRRQARRRGSRSDDDPGGTAS